ncbi:monosaccharide ABC transporter substrate-binding protein (CUT2 family) [Hydrogenispora ethanolica]|uniref:Monosaccharide ABC transporter substrate-binding protein (CUT2 family) n=1 Tax=Hydrogenispora ethanolica TaxID=1082276 RepID=A0A4V2QGT2_HYDET|nr:ABC transporter substrate-binding protein [Hydrogenispora ethanolica]TCL77017.1 monosaccharide ABC transporter substrate-binding protein (CUT2 family) [Hydrogenispora ethanolica]
MKKIIGLMMICVMIFAMTFTGYAAPNGPIGIVVPSADHGWMAAVSYFARQKALQLGLKEGIGYKLVTSANVNEQANQIDEMIALNCSAIVLLPHNDEVSVAADKILKNKIKLVLFDRKVSGDYTAYIAGDNVGLGVKAAEYIGKKLGGKGTVAVMNTPSVGSVSSERVRGFKQTVAKKFPGLKLVDVTSGGFSMEDGLKMATDMLVAYPKLDAVFSIDDEPSMGILQAIKDAKRKDIKLLSGGGGTQTYFKTMGQNTGIDLFTVTYSPSMIKDAIQAAYDITKGKTVKKNTIIPPTVVNKDNFAKFLDKGSPY